jgi:hypothetical protein
LAPKRRRRTTTRRLKEKEEEEAFEDLFLRPMQLWKTIVVVALNSEDS